MGHVSGLFFGYHWPDTAQTMISLVESLKIYAYIIQHSSIQQVRMSMKRVSNLIVIALLSMFCLSAFSAVNNGSEVYSQELEQDKQITDLLEGARDFFSTHKYDDLIAAASELSQQKISITYILDSVMIGMNEQQKARFVAAVERKYRSLLATVSLPINKETRDVAIMGLAIVGVLDGIEQIN